MLPTETWIAFATATAIFAYMPGPALLYTAAQTLAGGQRRGFWASLGLHLGGYFHVAAAALGLTALMTQVPTAYFVLKVAGAIYLVWLGAQLIWKARKPTTTAVSESMVSRKGDRPLAQSALVEILNPKTALFFYAFLPQFVDPTSDIAPWAQFLILGTLVNVAFSSADVLCVLFAAWVSGAVKRSARATAWVRALGGTILVGLGLRLAFDRS